MAEMDPKELVARLKAAEAVQARVREDERLEVLTEDIAAERRRKLVQSGFAHVAVIRHMLATPNSEHPLPTITHHTSELAETLGADLGVSRGGNDGCATTFSREHVVRRAKELGMVTLVDAVEALPLDRIFVLVLAWRGWSLFEMVGDDYVPYPPGA